MTLRAFILRYAVFASVTAAINLSSQGVMLPLSQSSSVFALEIGDGTPAGLEPNISHVNAGY